MFKEQSEAIAQLIKNLSPEELTKFLENLISERPEIKETLLKELELLRK